MFGGVTAENTTPDRETVHPHDGQVVGVTVWSPQKAAKECQMGRSTIMRKLYAGEIPGAEKVDGAWKIPVPGLIAAGLKPGRPTPPEKPESEGDHAVQRGVRETVQTGAGVSTGEPYVYLREIAELKAQVEIEKARAEVEAARREAAEQLAEERRGRITDLQQALRMLTPAPKTAKRCPLKPPGMLTSSSTTMPNPAAPATPGHNHDAEPMSPETANPGSPTEAEPQGILSRIRTWLV